ncbi:MAG: NAD(+) kinase [Bacteroidetes bacterium]|nr:MAG: NAD(+) kinase [Bacteroidota bacterium]
MSHESFDALVSFFHSVHARGWRAVVYRPMLDWLYSYFGYRPEIHSVFTEASELPEGLDLLISLGGDGTFLDSAQYVLPRQVPILGINFGHLGFLASGSTDNIGEVLDMVSRGEYDVERRVTAAVRLLREGAPQSLTALNDITLQKNGKSMLIINVHIDGTFLCTYWCDGLIVSTPTGSTAYSLSVGGPIMLPAAATVLMSPIAPHNLGMRPLVLPDSAEIHLRATSRDPRMVLGVDAQQHTLSGAQDFTIARGEHAVHVVRLRGDNFYTALREKLNWGMDARN